MFLVGEVYFFSTRGMCVFLSQDKVLYISNIFITYPECYCVAQILSDVLSPIRQRLSGNTFDLYEQSKTKIISARAARDRVLTDQREKVLRMLLNGSMYLLTDQREKVLWMLLNGSMYLERCFSQCKSINSLSQMNALPPWLSVCFRLRVNFFMLTIYLSLVQRTIKCLTH